MLHRKHLSDTVSRKSYELFPWMDVLSSCCANLWLLSNREFFLLQTSASSRQGSSFNQSSLLSSSTPVSNQVSTTQTKTETQSSGKFPPNKPMVVSIQQGKVVTKQPGSVMFPFERNDFNPRSQEVLNKTYTDHKSYSKLYNLILKQGFELQKPLYDSQSKLRDKLTYEQLLQGTKSYLARIKDF